METFGNGVPFMRAAELARRGDAAAVEVLIGPAQLIGVRPAPPTPEATSDDEWSYQTRSATPVSVVMSVKLGIDVEEAFIFAVRKQRQFFAGTILVGRASTSDVFIDHTSISKLHARMRQANDGSWTIEDAGSTNGTRLNSRPVGAAQQPIAFGARVQLGDCAFRFERLAETLTILKQA